MADKTVHFISVYSEGHSRGGRVAAHTEAAISDERQEAAIIDTLHDDLGDDAYVYATGTVDQIRRQAKRDLALPGARHAHIRRAARETLREVEAHQGPRGPIEASTQVQAKPQQRRFPRGPDLFETSNRLPDRYSGH